MPTEKEMMVDPSIIKSMYTYSPETGCLLWANDNRSKGWKKTQSKGLPAFTTIERKGYKNGKVLGLLMKEHRVVWAWHFGKWPDFQIDHINGNTSDNRIENLRQVENDVNCRNQSMPKSNTSGYVGVSFHSQIRLWSAKYRKDYKDYHVGYFQCKTAAAIAVMQARLQHDFTARHGEKKLV